MDELPKILQSRPKYTKTYVRGKNLSTEKLKVHRQNPHDNSLRAHYQPIFILEDKYKDLNFPRIPERILKTSYVDQLVEMEKILNNQNESNSKKFIRPARTKSMDLRKIINQK